MPDSPCDHDFVLMSMDGAKPWRCRQCGHRAGHADFMIPLDDPRHSQR